MLSNTIRRLQAIAAAMTAAIGSTASSGNRSRYGKEEPSPFSSNKRGTTKEPFIPFEVRRRTSPLRLRRTVTLTTTIVISELDRVWVTGIGLLPKEVPVTVTQVAQFTATIVSEKPSRLPKLHNVQYEFFICPDCGLVITVVDEMMVRYAFV